MHEESGLVTALPLRSAGSPERGLWSAQRYLERLEKRLEYRPAKVELARSPRADPVRAVLAESENHDLLVLSLQRSFLRQVGVPGVAELIARRYRKPLVLAKASKGLGALARKWI